MNPVRPSTLGYEFEVELPDGRRGAIMPLSFGRARLIVFKNGRLGQAGVDDGW